MAFLLPHIRVNFTDEQGKLTKPAYDFLLHLETATAGGVSGPAGGDLSGTYPNPTLRVIGAGGTVGSATMIPVVTYDTKGRIVNASEVPFSVTASQSWNRNFLTMGC